MLIKLRKVVIFLIWILTLWLAFWGGFYKSMIISGYTQYLGEQVQVADKKGLLKKIDEGDISGARDALAARISIETSLLEMHKYDGGSLSEWAVNMIYPREGITLISVYNYRLDKRRQSTPAGEVNEVRQEGSSK